MSTHITNNFYGNIGQHVDHIDHQILHMDKDGSIHIEQIGKMESQVLESREEAAAGPIKELPRKGDYNAVRVYIEERKRTDEAFKEFCLAHSRPDICELLTKDFGWMVDSHSLGANINRHL